MCSQVDDSVTETQCNINMIQLQDSSYMMATLVLVLIMMQSSVIHSLLLQLMRHLINCSRSVQDNSLPVYKCTFYFFSCSDFGWPVSFKMIKKKKLLFKKQIISSTKLFLGGHLIMALIIFVHFRLRIMMSNIIKGYFLSNDAAKFGL